MSDQSNLEERRNANDSNHFPSPENANEIDQRGPEESRNGNGGDHFPSQEMADEPNQANSNATSLSTKGTEKGILCFNAVAKWHLAWDGIYRSLNAPLVFQKMA